MADNVVDLGQFGDPRPSPFSKLPGVFKDITDSNIEREKMSLSLLKTKQQDKVNKNRLQIALAKQQAEDDKTHHDNTVKALEQTSLYMSDKNPQEQAMFKTTPHYKEILNLTKKYAPEYVDDDKQLALPEPKDIYKDALDKQKYQLQQKIQSGAKLTDGEQKLSDFLQKTDTSLMGNALHAASQDPNFKADPNATMKQYIASAIQAKKGVQSGNSDFLTPDSSSQTQQSNPLSSAIAGDQSPKDNSDPLGILKYLKPGGN